MFLIGHRRPLAHLVSYRAVNMVTTHPETNRIQFQPGLSLAKFFRRFGTRAQCQQALFEMRSGIFKT